jgi:hypothetical protein
MAAGPTNQTANVIWGSVPRPQRNFSNSEPGATPPENLGFVATITNEFILGLDILRPYNASVYIGRQRLRLVEEKFQGREPALLVW